VLLCGCVPSLFWATTEHKGIQGMLCIVKGIQGMLCIVKGIQDMLCMV
jgi:hypothetical protein